MALFDRPCSSSLLLAFVLVLFFARPALAFGAGNISGISKVEGQNWRHGDIEDALLKIVMARVAGGKKFNKMMVSRVYFGNWLRDYSQAIDVGTVKNVSAEAIRLLIAILGFLTFGFGSNEFEVTADRLLCYRPEDHIDNPKNYADNIDARRYDPRLRGPVDERVELAIDEDTGMKNYIANDRAGIMTSAFHVRRLFAECIRLGRRYHGSRNKDELYEALRLMGTGLHCLEDFLAHSNYTELALIEMGERDIFPHVGRNTRMRLPGVSHSVYTCVTGTFGGVDFLHSVTGEVSDKLTQNEIETLEGTLQDSQNSDTSILENLMDKIPDGILGRDDKKQQMHDLQDSASAAQMQQTSVSPREPEEFTMYVQRVFDHIMPAIKFHDELLQKISEAIERIPILPKLIEEVEDQLSVFVFSIIAPFVVPLISQIKNELRTGSEEIVESSANEQHIVFNDDDCTDPTHSMLSKDHFSNILNEIAGRAASKVVSWVVPQLMKAWDDENVDVDRTIDRIIHGVFHHPAMRDQGEDGASECRSLMFSTVEEWWGEKGEEEKDDLRRKLGRDGVLNGENHKEGVQDTGHGCCKPLGMHKQFSGGDTMEDRIVSAAAGAIVGGVTGGISDIVQSQTGMKLPMFDQQGSSASSSAGRDGGGGLGGLIGAVAGSLFGGGSKEEDTTTHVSSGRTADGGYNETVTSYGHSGDRYGQAQYSETQYPGGGARSEYQRYEQDEPSAGSGRGEATYGYDQRTETRPTYGGGYEERTERTWEDSQGGYRRQEEVESWGGRGGQYGEAPERRGWGGDRQEEAFEQPPPRHGHHGHHQHREEDRGGWEGERPAEGFGYEERRERGSSGNRSDRFGGRGGDRPAEESGEYREEYEGRREGRRDDGEGWGREGERRGGGGWGY